MNALIFNGTVIQIEASTFPVHSALEWVAIPSGTNVAVGWTYASGTFTAPPAPPAPTLAQQAAAALGAGLTITSTGTMTLAATAFPTDPTSTGKITAVVTAITADGT
ncbi:MAG: hypothetical protein B7X09_05185, partial [Acidiphilium sp. 21-66-27]